MYTDTSGVGIGAGPTQIGDGETETDISCASKAFSRVEKTWTTTSAVVWALQHFHPHVYRKKVRVLTDHKTLTWLIFHLKHILSWHLQ